MTHEMKLQPKYYDYILKGTKRIELRLFDEKRQEIKVGDKIKFIKESSLTESFEVVVNGLLNYNNFDNLFMDYSVEMLADAEMTKKELKIALEKFYTPEKQAKYGVLGIKIELI